MHLAFGHFDDDESIGERHATDCLDGLHLQPRPRQTLGEILGVDVVNLNKLIQPTEWKLHL